MHVGGNRYAASHGFQYTLYVCHIGSLADTLRGETHKFPSGIGYRLCLTGGSLGIERRRIGHGLYKHRCVPSDNGVADFDRTRLTADIIISEHKKMLKT